MKKLKLSTQIKAFCFGVWWMASVIPFTEKDFTVLDMINLWLIIIVTLVLWFKKTKDET